MNFIFTTPAEKQAHIDAVKLVALNNAREYVSETIRTAPECRFELKFESSEIAFIIEDELMKAGWLCVFRDNFEDGRVKASFVPGEPRKRLNDDGNGKCVNCGKGTGRHFDDDDRPVNSRRNYCYKRGEENQSARVDT